MNGGCFPYGDVFRQATDHTALLFESLIGHICKSYPLEM